MSANRSCALVTGGSRGIGRAICLDLARRGICVAVNYTKSPDSAEDVAAACRSMGVDAFAVQADISDPAACFSMVETVLTRFGRLDILVNNAGITRDRTTLNMSIEDWDSVLNTNLRGAFCCTKAVIPTMKLQNHGRIINISSISGLHGNVGQANYSASKAGLIGMTKTHAKELARYGITVNAVAPGFVETDMTAAIPEAIRSKVLTTIPVGFLGQPEDIAAVVAFFAGEDARYITGQTLTVDGGRTL